MPAATFAFARAARSGARRERLPTLAGAGTRRAPQPVPAWAWGRGARGATSPRAPVAAGSGRALAAPTRPRGCGGASRRPALLELLERARPVVPQETRQRTVREHPPPCLAARAVVGLVLRVDDALDGRATGRARLSIATVDGHAVAECGHALREAAGRLSSKAVDPVGQRGPHRLEETGGLVGGQPAREHHRRQARAVEDLVGIRIADAAQEPRVGERALERVALARERSPEAGEIRLHHLDAARVVLAQRALAPDQVDGRAPARPG